MTCPAAMSESARLTAGTPVVFETGGVVFSATIIDATAEDRLLVTIHEASDPRFAARLPKRLWLANVASRLRQRTLRVAGPTQRLAFSGRWLAPSAATKNSSRRALGVTLLAGVAPQKTSLAGETPIGGAPT